MDNTCLFNTSNLLRVVWEITHRCNYGCLHCCANAEKDDDHDLSKSEVYKKLLDNELNLEQIDTVLKNLSRHKLASIYYSGGEPFIRKDMFDIIRLTTKYVEPKNMSIATNGKLITKESAHELKNLEIGLILVSLDGHDEKTSYDFRLNKYAYRDSINAARLISEAGTKVRMGVVLWKDNYQHLEQFVKIGIENGIDQVFFNWPMPVGRFTQNPWLAPPIDEYFKIGRSIDELSNKYEGKINVKYHRFNLITEQDSLCSAGSKIFHLNPDAKISPCSWLFKCDPSLISESSLLEKDLGAILEEPAFVRVIDMMKKRKVEGAGPGCLAACKLFIGGYESYDPLLTDKGKWCAYAK